MNENNTPAITFDVPRLRIGSSPVSVESVSLIKASETRATMNITISRDLTIPLESFTFRYRFSALPLDEPDSRHAWHDYVYTDPNMNELPLISFDASVPSKMKLDGCTAYVSQARLLSGGVIDFPPSGFTDEPEPEITFPPVVTKPPQSEAARKKKSSRLAVGLTIFFFLLIVEIFGGVYIYNFVDLRSSVMQLIKEERFNEAYKLTVDQKQTYLLQHLCEQAADKLIDNRCFTEAYAYAAGAPEPFTDEIIERSAEMVVDPDSGELNEDAYRVAKMSSDDGKFSEIVRSIIAMLESKEDFPNALRVASELRSENERRKTEDEIFNSAVKNFLSRHEFDKFLRFVDELEYVDSFDIDDTGITNAIIDYCVNSADSSSLIYFSTLYPDRIDLSGIEITIKPDDNGIHAALPIIWPLLTEQQKRVYHSRDLAVYKEQFVIRDGRLDGLEYTNVVSVDTYEYHTAALLSSGQVVSVTVDGHGLAETFPETNDVIQIAVGKSHTVMLHANGNVSAVGDNTYGQCDVSSWQDIAAVAAGQSFTIGLKADGTLVATGSNSCGQRDVDAYRNVSAIACGAQTSVLLFSDGTVGLQGYKSLGLEAVETLEGVTAIRAAETGVLVKLKNGRFQVFSGSTLGSYGSAESWIDALSFDIGSFRIAALDRDSRLIESGDNLPAEPSVETTAAQQ